MDNTAYTENLNRIATKLAKEYYGIQNLAPLQVSNMLPLAAIALEEMALSFRLGYLAKSYNEEYGNALLINGLIPTKTDSNG